MDWIHLAEARQLVGAHEYGKNPLLPQYAGYFGIC